MTLSPELLETTPTTPPAKKEQVATRIIFLLQVLRPLHGQQLSLLSKPIRAQMTPHLDYYFSALASVR